jgi:hypothetical protein
MNETRGIATEGAETEPSPAKRKPSEKLRAIREKEADFVTKAELAHHIGCHVNTINRWIRMGTIPGPHCRPGGKHPIWLRKHYEAFRRTGEWPPESFRGRMPRD